MGRSRFDGRHSALEGVQPATVHGRAIAWQGGD